MLNNILNTYLITIVVLIPFIILYCSVTNSYRMQKHTLKDIRKSTVSSKKTLHLLLDDSNENMKLPYSSEGGLERKKKSSRNSTASKKDFKNPNPSPWWLVMLL